MAEHERSGHANTNAAVVDACIAVFAGSSAVQELKREVALQLVALGPNGVLHMESCSLPAVAKYRLARQASDPPRPGAVLKADTQHFVYASGQVQLRTDAILQTSAQIRLQHAQHAYPTSQPGTAKDGAAETALEAACRAIFVGQSAVASVQREVALLLAADLADGYTPARHHTNLSVLPAVASYRNQRSETDPEGPTLVLREATRFFLWDEGIVELRVDAVLAAAARARKVRYRSAGAARDGTMPEGGVLDLEEACRRVFGGTSPRDVALRDIALMLAADVAEGGPGAIEGGAIGQSPPFCAYREANGSAKIKALVASHSQFFTFHNNRLQLNAAEVLAAAASPGTLAPQPLVSAPSSLPPPPPVLRAPQAPATPPQARHDASPAVPGPGMKPQQAAQGASAAQPAGSNPSPTWTLRCSAPQEPGQEAGDLASFVTALPEKLTSSVLCMAVKGLLTDVLLDEGAPPVLRFLDREPVRLHGEDVNLADAVRRLLEVKRGPGEAAAVSPADCLSPGVLDGLFDVDNRLGLPGTLHRISAMRTRDRSISGLTYRLGRHLPGAASLVRDLLQEVADTVRPDATALGNDATARCGSILLVGRPGSGKTTLLRDMARVLADDLGLAVIVVDTNMELGGDARVAHHALGTARRMQVVDVRQQHDTLIEAVQNHAPQVVVVDEIGTAQEVAAVRSISQRGIAMLGTAHGTDLTSLLANPVLLPLMGGVKNVTLGDLQARRQTGSGAGVRKTQLERAGPPAFTSLVEVLGQGQCRVHRDLAASIDQAWRADT